MSHSYYNALWRQSMQMLAQQIEQENPSVQLNPDTGKVIASEKTQLTPQEASHHYSLLFLQYNQIARNLCLCHDQLVQPQKRRDVRLALDTVLARMHQLMGEVSKFSSGIGSGNAGADYPQFTTTARMLHLTQQQCEIPIPTYFREQTLGLAVNSAISGAAAAAAPISPTGVQRAQVPLSPTSASATAATNTNVLASVSLADSDAAALASIVRAREQLHRLIEERELTLGSPEERLNNKNGNNAAQTAHTQGASKGIALQHAAAQQLIQMSRAEAVRVLARYERGRQAQQRGKLMFDLWKEEQKTSAAAASASPSFASPKSTRGSVNYNFATSPKGRASSVANVASFGAMSNANQLAPHAAATRIQKTFRGHLSRLQTARSQQEEDIFIGMKSPIKTSQSNAQATVIQPASNQSGAATKVKYDPVAKENEIRQLRKQRQQDTSLVYQQALLSTVGIVETEEAPMMRERMWDARYAWWIEQKEKTGAWPQSFDEYYLQCEPESEAATAVRERQAKNAAGKKKKVKLTPEQQKAELEAKKAEAAAKAKEKAASAAAKAKLDASGKKASAQTVPAHTLTGPSSLLNHMYASLCTYRDVWSKLDESTSLDEQHNVELLKQQRIRPMVAENVRQTVDAELLRYLDNIRREVAKAEAARKAKKQRIRDAKKKKVDASATGDKAESKEQEGDDAAASPKKKSAAGAKSGKSKGAKAKKLTEGEKQCQHMTLHEMMQLLVKMNIIQKFGVDDSATSGSNSSNANSVSTPQKNEQVTTMQQFVGDSSLSLSAPNVPAVSLASAQAPFPIPSHQQLRQLITVQLALPLGSSFVKQEAALTSAALFYGSRGTGKRLMTRILASETRAVLFDCSPWNLAGKLGHGGKHETAKLVHMIFTCAVAVQPSIILLDGVEPMFEALSKTDAESVAHYRQSCELTKFRQLLSQYKLSHCTRMNRVLILALSHGCPPMHAHKLDTKALQVFFGRQQQARQYLFPMPDYLTRLRLWRYFLLERSGLSGHVCDWLQTARESAQLQQQQSTTPAVTATATTTTTEAPATETASRIPGIGVSGAKRLDFTALASVSGGYTAGSIEQACLAVLPASRVAKINSAFAQHGTLPAVSSTSSASSQQQLQICNAELLSALSATPVIYSSEQTAILAYTEQVTGEAQRRKLVTAAVADEAEKQAADKGNKRPTKRTAK